MTSHESRLDNSKANHPEHSDPFPGLAHAVEPQYQMRDVNDGLLLFQGPVQLTLPSTCVCTEGRVTLQWQPAPHLLLDIQVSDMQLLTGPDGTFAPPPVYVRLGALSESISALWIAIVPSEHDVRVSLRLSTPVGTASTCAAPEVRFCVVNSRDLSFEPLRYGRGTALKVPGRAIFADGAWTVTLDKVREHATIQQSLMAVGGYAITHVGRLTRIDGGTICLRDFTEFKRLFEHYLAFATAYRPQCILPSGFDSEGKALWQIWEDCADEPWRCVANWSSDIPSRAVASLFPGFTKLCGITKWKEPLELAVDWYVQSMRGAPETGILLSQSALELLSWVSFVEYGQLIRGEDAFEKLWASDRIRLLLDRFDISMAIPDDLTKLATIKTGEGKPVDGPHAITELRNAIVHPKASKRARLRASPGATHEAVQLGVQYVERVLVKLVEGAHKGPAAGRPVC